MQLLVKKTKKVKQINTYTCYFNPIRKNSPTFQYDANYFESFYFDLV